jgi:hypothetical protein
MDSAARTIAVKPITLKGSAVRLDPLVSNTFRRYEM